MALNGLHLLLTYQCTYECEHCFVWGSPRQSGVMSLEQVRQILYQAEQAGGIEWIYFEGGEPFLYYPTLRRGVELARQKGFRVGIVTNAYWATGPEDAEAALQPFAGLIEDLSISSDLFHASEMLSQQARDAAAAAEALNIPMGFISIAPLPEKPTEDDASITYDVMFRGRAAEQLAQRVPGRPWQEFTACPHEDLADPSRVHVDPLLNVHLCQGLLMGNLAQLPLRELIRSYNPSSHPIVAALLQGGPAELARRFALPHQELYADACHLCYTARLRLRERFPDLLAPDQVFGVGL